MSTIARRSLAFVAVLLALLLVTEHGSAGNPERGSARFPLGSHLVEVTSVEGKLVFQRVDSAGNLIGEPWFWPEGEGSPVRYEEPRLVDKEGALWLGFVERRADGNTRSRAVSLTEIFADGFESANTAAWSSTEPAVNLFFESPAQGAAANSASPAIRMLFATPTGIAIAPETLAFTQGGAPLAMSCSPIEGGAECLPDAPFAEGAVHLEATIADMAAHVSPIASRDFTVDTAAPGIVLSSPAEGFLTGQGSILVAGSLSELATLQVGGTTIPVAAAR